MQVEIRDHVGHHPVTKELVTIRHYLVYVDGRYEGLISWKKDSILCLSRQHSPLRANEIAREVARALGRNNVRLAMPPTVPASLLRNQQSEQEQEDFDDDFYG